MSSSKELGFLEGIMEYMNWFQYMEKEAQAMWKRLCCTAAKGRTVSTNVHKVGVVVCLFVFVFEILHFFLTTRKRKYNPLVWLPES